jgi:hypothetical protein
MNMGPHDIRKYLQRLGEILSVEAEIEILLIGGAAGMLTDQFSPSRTTTDCDVIRYNPADSQERVLDAAKRVAAEYQLPEAWLNSKAMQLDILPDGWQFRKVHVDTFDSLKVYALSRKDLLATKFYAGHPRDVEDIDAMQPDADELAFAGTYLNMLRVPSRQANLDGVARGMMLLRAMEGDSDE